MVATGQRLIRQPSIRTMDELNGVSRIDEHRDSRGGTELLRYRLNRGGILGIPRSSAETPNRRAVAYGGVHLFHTVRAHDSGRRTESSSRSLVHQLETFTH